MTPITRSGFEGPDLAQQFAAKGTGPRRFGGETDAPEADEEHGYASDDLEEASTEPNEFPEKRTPGEWRRQLIREARSSFVRLSPRTLACIASRERRSLARRAPPPRTIRRICTGSRFRRTPRPPRRPSTSSRPRSRAAPDPEPAIDRLPRSTCSVSGIRNWELHSHRRGLHDGGSS